MAGSKKYYAVRKGRKPGIYTSWSGANGAEAQIRGFAGARYKGFAARADAEAWLSEQDVSVLSPGKTDPEDPSAVQIYTDGACSGNPGPGGFGVIIRQGNPPLETELSGGYRHTTKKRMELLACIRGLEALASGTAADLYTDSSYVANGINKGWAVRWRSRNWLKGDGQPAENIDLWKRLLDLCEIRQVRFHWIRGHAGHPENERCDRLAVAAAASADLPEDPRYS